MAGKHAIHFDPEGKVTRGSFKDEVDINNIVERFTRTGEMPRGRYKPQYGDAPEQSFFESAVINAEIASKVEEGMEMPEPSQEVDSEESDDTEALTESPEAEEVATDEED